MAVSGLRVAILVVLTALGAVPACTQETLSERIAKHAPVPSLAPGQMPGNVVEYDSRGLRLKGILYLPQGKGPFPVVLFNHGADKNPNSQPELARFYGEHGFAFFLPYRRGHGGNPGRTVDELLSPAKAENTSDIVADEKFVGLLDDENADLASAIAWLRTNKSIDNTKIFMSGISYGSLQTLISAETIPGLRGCIVFSGGARLWSNPVLQKRLIRAVQAAQSPIFLIEAANDYSTGPLDGLGPLLKQKGEANRSKLYPSFGDPGNVRMGHIAFSTWDLGTQIWGADVVAFMSATQKKETNKR